MNVEIVPSILRTTWEKIEEEWRAVQQVAGHIQIDITDGIFAGEGTFRDIAQFKRLPESEKIELHLMVHTPGNFVDAVIDLRPARCIFHLESFSGTGEVRNVYTKLHSETQTELALALNPASPPERLEEYLDVLDYVMFLGVQPGWGGQAIDPHVFRRIGAGREAHPTLPIAVDGGVSKETIGSYVAAGARMICANTAIFAAGNPAENLRQLQLLAAAAVKT